MRRNRAEGQSNRRYIGVSRRGSRTAAYLMAAASAAGFLPSLRHATAANFTWTGASSVDNNWLTADNWSSTVAPSGTSANLNFTGTVQLTSNNNNNAGTQFANIIFQTGAGAFILTGNALTLAASSAPTVSDLSTSLETIDLPLTVSSGRVIGVVAGGTLSIADGLTNTSGVEFGNSTTQSNQPAFTGTIVLNSPGTWTTSSAVTPNTIVFSGTLQVGAGGSLPTGNTPGTQTGWIALGSAGNATLSLPSSAGYLVLGDATTPINSTIAHLGVTSGAAAGSSVFGGNASTSTLTINDLQSGVDSYSGNLGGAGTNQNNLALVITGGNTVALSGTNTFIGGTTVQNGVLQTASNSAIPAGGSVTLGDAGNDNATLDLDAHTATIGLLSTVGSGNIRIGNGSASATMTTGTLAYAGGATPSTFGGVIVDNFGAAGQVGVSRVTVTSGTLSLTNTNTYSGPTTLGGGTLIFSPGSIGTGSVVLDGGTLMYSASNTTDITTQTLALGINGGTINTNGNNVTFASSIAATSTGGFVKAGAGTLAIAAANSYPKDTTVTGGTLLVSNTSGSATGTGDVVLDGGNLASGAVGSVSGNVTAGLHAHTIAPGAIGSIGTLSIGGLTTTNLSTLNFDLGTGSGIITNGDLLVLGSGTISIGSGTIMSFGGSTVLGNDYRLIGDTSSGGVVGAIPLGNFVLPTAPAGQSYSLSTSVDAGFIDLVVGASGPTTLTWNNASANGLWDFNSSNWNNGSSNAAFTNNSSVAFTDTNGGAANYAVTLNTTVTPGSIVVNNSAGNYSISGTGKIAGSALLTKNGSSNLAINTSNTSLGAVSILGGTVQLGSNTGGTTMTSLSISGAGVLDINNNHVIINYGSGSDPISSIAALLATGFNGGLWNGAGGIISSAAAANSGSYGVGFADAADPGNPAGLASGTILIEYTLLGDADLNHIVNGIDFGIVAANFNKGVTSWDQGDFDYSHIVNGIDFGDLAANFNKGASGADAWNALVQFAEANGLMADVPEPASIGLIGIAGMGLLARRRAKRK